MKTAFQYIRISNEDQSNFSISGQQMINEQWAFKNNIKIIKTFIDDGYSAKDFNRPQWKELEATIAKSKVDFLIITKYDRLIRNVIEGLAFVEKLEQKWKITLLSVMENYSIDIMDPYFFKQRADMFVDADFERRRIADRTKFGIMSGKLEGRYLTKAPYGYTNARDERDKPIIVINPIESKIVEDIYTNFINEVPLPIIQKKAIEKGFTMKGNECIKRILTNSVYAGLISVKAYRDNEKKVVKGLHAPIISEEIYWTAYYKMQDKIRPQTKLFFDENLPLRGFLKCECGKHLTGAKCKGKLKHYHYYWCGEHRQPNFNSTKVDNDMTTILSELSLKKDFIEALRIEAEIQFNKSKEERQEQLKRANSELLNLKNKVKVIDEKYFENKISDSTYKEWHSTYTTDIHHKSIEVANLNKGEKELNDLFNSKLDYLTDLNWLYKKAKIEDKQTYLKTIFPACLTATSKGYRTPLINSIFYVNSLKIGALLEVKKEGESTLFVNSPVGVADGIQNELSKLLLIIEKIVA